jgi:HPt (histidine-containing phosphotransfer) domain-containing protein
MQKISNHSLHIHSPVSELPLHPFSLSIDAPGSLAAEAFHQNPELPGVILMDGNALAGMIPRNSFHERIGRTYGVEVYLRRPLLTILQAVEHEPMILNEDCAIPAAAQAALSRKINEVYFPLVIKMQDLSFCMLDVYCLLQAQSRLLNFVSQVSAKPYHETKILPSVPREAGSCIMPVEKLNSRPSEEGILDVSCLKNLITMMGSQNGTPLHALANQLVDDIPMLFNDARQAIHQNDASSLEKAAHTIRITANTFGLCQLAEYAVELEALARKTIYSQFPSESQHYLDLAMESFPAARRSLFDLLKSMQ